MGTRGLFFIRCRGRYFVYYNQFDSYPEGLGDAILNEIPEDPEKYQEWLRFMRKVYAQLVHRFETQTLPVKVQSAREEYSSVALKERYGKSFWAIDDRLQLPPLQTIVPELMHAWNIEWTYTLDLDREVLTIDNSLHLHLARLPRAGGWIKYLGQDGRGRRAADRCTPGGVVANFSWKPEVDCASRDRYSHLDIQVAPLESFYDQGDIIDARESLLAAIFTRMHHRYRPVLDAYLPEWDPSCFSFREIAFAILSIAAGEITLECASSLDQNHQTEGYYLARQDVSPELTAPGYLPTVLPQFLHESHIPGTQSGSAPSSKIYWLRNVLVYLVTRLDLVEVEEASVTEVVETGLRQGLKDFHAMVFSILDVVLLRVQKCPDGTVHVSRSPLTTLIQFDDNNSGFANGPRTRVSSPYPAQEDTCTAEEFTNDFENLELASPCDSEKSTRENIASPSHEEVSGAEDVAASVREPQTSSSEPVESHLSVHEDPVVDDDHGFGPVYSLDVDDGSEDAASSELQEGSQLEYPASGSDISNDMGYDDDDGESTGDGSGNKTHTNAFLAVLRFFDAATYQNLKHAKSRVFPNEILGAIMKFSDTRTYRALGEVSSYCRRTGNREFRLNDDYAVVGFDSAEQNFVLENLHSGKKSNSQVRHSNEDSWFPITLKDDELKLNPVIGIADHTRQSILNSVGMVFSEVDHRRSPYTKQIDMPEQMYYDYYGGSQIQEPELLFNIEEHTYVGSVEDGWGRYLARNYQLNSGLDTSDYLIVHIRGPTFRCLLPPRYRELVMDNCNGLYCVLRHVRDESPEEWDLTMKHTLRQLHQREKTEKWNYTVSIRGRPVVVAFTTSVRLFYYVHRCEEPAALGADASSLSRDIAARCTDPDPSRRLIPLLPGGKTIDLKKSDERNEFESWMKIFCGNIGKSTEWDPFTEEQQPLIPNKNVPRSPVQDTDEPFL
ncbi:F-box domain protein [Aspergillus piperis CBS 112811]|uniref:F-box domain protein n=1 Tax=Aspergillus piperis CBS 112811 TaxID=1448313 RepID=A0A8G1VRT9_9EURO|nr:F-box domain protein [Aspergillus piperis CBS 112811]RAH62197.1 F-box domain protein [Aspergillus piperis CBS 112811]